jgi:hypothetical protein
VRLNRAPALRALVQHRRVPPVRRLARAQPHLGRFAFWNSHTKRATKAEKCRKATSSAAPGRILIVLLIRSSELRARLGVGLGFKSRSS